MPGKIRKPESDLFLTPDEFKVFRVAAYNHSLRSGLLFDVVCFGGLRISEALKITPADIRLPDVVVINTLKKRKPQADEILFPRNTMEAVIGYIRASRIKSTDPVFPITRQRAWQIYKQIMIKAKIKKNGSPHALRHCHGIQVMETTGDGLMCKLRLRHSNMNNTMRYVHLTRGMQSKIVKDMNRIFEKEK